MNHNLPYLQHPLEVFPYGDHPLLSFEEYIEERCCPWCLNEDHEFPGKQICEGDAILDKVWCPSCDHEWWEVGELVGYLPEYP